MSSILGSTFGGSSKTNLTVLNRDNLDIIGGQGKIDVPAYPLEQRKTGIVHFAPGHFFAGHLGVYADKLLKYCHENNLPLDYGIMAVSPRVRYDSAGKCAAISRRDALAKQDYMYTVVERYGDDINARVVGSLMGVMIGPEDRNAVYELLASPDTKIVTGTVTQKGYTYDSTNPNQEDQFAHYVYKGQALRFERGLEPLAYVSLDNIPKNSTSFSTMVEGYAALEQRPDIVAWLEQKGRVFDTMVDRIVPASTAESRSLVRDRFDIIDNSVIVTEPYKELVIGYAQDGSSCPVPFDIVGAKYSADVAKHADAKQELLNGPHFFAGVVGRVNGETYIEEAMARPGGKLFSLVEVFMKQVQATLPYMEDRDLDKYRGDLIHRFMNPEPKDPLQRLARNGTDKVSKRLFSALEKAYEQNSGRSQIVSGVAHWIVYMARANDDPSITHDTKDGFYIEDQKAYDEGYVRFAKSLNGNIAPMFALPIFAEAVNKGWGENFRQELQDSYTAIVHPTNDNLNPVAGNDKSAHTPNGPS